MLKFIRAGMYTSVQDGGREGDLVFGRQVVGVDRGRGHQPLVLVDRAAQARDMIVPVEGAGPLDVAVEVAVLDLQAREVAPPDWKMSTR